MLRTTHALAAMLTLGAVACTFEHSGLLAGGDDADLADASHADAPDGATADTGDGMSNGDDPGADGGATGDASTEGPSTRDGDDPTDSPSRPDGKGPVDANQVQEGAADAPPDGQGSGVDGRFDCALVPSGKTFTPPGATSAHCYWVHGTAGNWLGAANACIAERGHLVTLSSSAETMFVLGLLPPIAATDRIWIGGTDGRFSSDGPGSGPFVWITAEPMTFQDWAPNGEPNGACKMCSGAPCECEHRVAMTSDGRWEDLYEAVYYRSICEAEL
jgi:hypothetical protein